MSFLKHSILQDKRDISYHYDVGNDFYNIFLGKDFLYSCAYFISGKEDIDEAQTNKMEYICRKLRLDSGEKLLDIGCGWGGLLIYAAKKYGVYSHGITLSASQYEYAKEAIKKEKLEGSCKVELKDYREFAGEGVFDKIVSVGMFEHVGIKNLPTYFNAVRRLLKEKGLFLNHGITSGTGKNPNKKSSGVKFINKYVFPGGELTNINKILNIMENSDFEVLDVESLRTHYMETLRKWIFNLQIGKDKALKLVPEKIFRIWILYMAACSYNFERG